MGVISAIEQRTGLLSTIGKPAMNLKYPKEFELYVIALELTDINFNTLSYFIFPINPSSLEETEVKITNIRKTLAGITVLRNPTFVPTNIALSGSFGRNFKVVLNEKTEDFIHSFINPLGVITTKSALKGAEQIFDERIKTGYGCIKILEDIIQKSTQLDNDGNMMRLIFHNPALGNSYLVEPGNLTFRMNEQTNMIWNYSLQLTSVAPLESIFSQAQLQSAAKELVINGYIQQKVNKTVNGINILLGKGIDRLPLTPLF